MAGGGQQQGYANGGIIGQGFGSQQANPNPQFNTHSAYNNFASPNSNFMSYPQQGQPNQPPTMTNNLPHVQSNTGPYMGGTATSNDMGFDNSGGDSGIEGQPTQMQTPLQAPTQNQPFGQPPNLSQYMPQQGLQIQGNPTSMPVQRPQQR